MKYKYDVSLSLQLIHLCALKTTEMIKQLFMYKQDIKTLHFLLKFTRIICTHVNKNCLTNKTVQIC